MLRSASFLAPWMLAVAVSAQSPEVWTFGALLRATSDLDALWRAPAVGERCVQFSSYDRRSHAGPADPDAWYGNQDRGQFLRTLERDGRTEHVLVDAAGPGAIVRIWSANPSGRLFFYFDREAEPRWVVDFAELLGGAIDGLGEPWCGTRARGGNCHLPIPFAEHVLVTSDAADFYYQVNVRHFGGGARAPSFEPAWLIAERGAIAAAGLALQRGGEPIPAFEGGEHVRFAAAPRPASDAQGGVVHARRFTGPGVLRALRVRAVHADPARAAVARRTLRVVVRADGAVCVDVPLADLFGSAPGLKPWRGLALGVLEDGTGYCDFPMPCRESLEVELVADGELPADVRIAGELAFVRGAVPPDALTFRASWHLDRERRTRPFGDHAVLVADGGAGRYVGTTLVVRNPTKAWWGEGDERITVDGEAFPSTFGTGTEDYFGYAWCCPERFEHPLHAQPQADGPANFGYACNVRLHVADAVPWQRSLRFDLEVWHWQDVVVDYATVAYWYGAPGVTAELPPMPPAEARLPVTMEPPVAFVAAGVLEAEDLRIVERTGGRTQAQDMGGFDRARWSRDLQLWWVDGAPGDRLVLAVPVGERGRYRVQAALTTARDYAVVRFAIAGQELGEAVDLYSPEVGATGVVELGTVELEAGEAQLSIEIVGRNESAEPRHMVGVDYVKLVPAR